jgi:hypothetical protein
MKSKSIKGKSAEEIKRALQECMSDNFKPTLAVIFLSVAQDRDAVCKVFDDRDIAIYGATTNGEFIDSDIAKESVAVLLLDIDKSYFNIYFDEYQDKDPREAARGIAKEALMSFPNPAFLIAASHVETDAEQLLFGFEDVIGKDVNVFGGMAGDDYTFVDQFVFTNGSSSNRGVVAVALDQDKIIIKGRATCGWRAMGTPKTVTKSEGNHVYTIDDVSVLEMTKKYSGLENLNENNPAIVMEIATSFPLQLQRDKGDPVMRPGLVVNWEDGSFICSGSVPQGSKVRFSLPPDFDVIEKVIQSCEDLKITEMQEADAVIVFTCAGRLLALGPLMSKEIEGIQDVWNVPMVGFFSNGELARATDGNLEMHNLTSCCVALKERK